MSARVYYCHPPKIITGGLVSEFKGHFSSEKDSDVEVQLVGVTLRRRNADYEHRYGASSSIAMRRTLRTYENLAVDSYYELTDSVGVFDLYELRIYFSDVEAANAGTWIVRPE